MRRKDTGSTDQASQVKQIARQRTGNEAPTYLWSKPLEDICRLVQAALRFAEASGSNGACIVKKKLSGLKTVFSFEGKSLTPDITVIDLMLLWDATKAVVERFAVWYDEWTSELVARHNVPSGLGVA